MRGGRLKIPAEGIETSRWGPALWTVLHTAAQFTTTTRQSNAWGSILSVMKSALPCPVCRTHYTAWIDANPLNLPAPGPELQVAISSWLLALHNDINVRNGKEPWTLDKLAPAYQNKAAAKTALGALRPYLPLSLRQDFGLFW